jgi:hypothetical protein
MFTPCLGEAEELARGTSRKCFGSVSVLFQNQDERHGKPTFGAGGCATGELIFERNLNATQITASVSVKCGMHRLTC